MNHDQIVKHSSDWLRSKCHIVLCEQKSIYNNEIPDVLGFTHNSSVLIECKASRSDFLADKNKVFKSNEESIGKYRMYACPKGMIKKHEIPENWGLLYIYPSGNCRCEKKIFKSLGSVNGTEFKRDINSEMNCLISAHLCTKQKAIWERGIMIKRRYESRIRTLNNSNQTRKSMIDSLEKKLILSNGVSKDELEKMTSLEKNIFIQNLIL